MIKTKFRVGGQWTRKQLAELLLVGPAQFDEPKGVVSLMWLGSAVVGDAALELIDNHPQHLLVLVDHAADPKATLRAIRVLGEAGQPYTIWQATLDCGFELRYYPAGPEQQIVCPTDRDGHPLLYGSQLRELRRLLVEGRAALALGYLDEHVPEIPPLPPFELVE
jgi:hypothetical protein